MRIRSKLAALAGGLLLVGMTAAGGVAYADDHDDRYDIPQAVLDDLGEIENIIVEGREIDYPTIAGLWYEEKISYSWNQGATADGSPVADPDGYSSRAELQAHIDTVCANNGAGGGVAPIDNPYGPPYFLNLTCAEADESVVEADAMEDSSTEESGAEDSSSAAVPAEDSSTEDSVAGAS